MNISGNTIFIPGATSGIGLGFARRFAAAGNRVVIAGRRQQLIDRIVAETDGIDGFVLDVTDLKSIDDAAETIRTRFPDTNVIALVAGIQLPEDLHSSDFLQTAEATVATNLLGPIRLVAAFSEFLAAKEKAAILTVSSGLAFVPLPLTPTYNATKAGIHSFSQSLRVQLSDTNVQVIEIVPPPVRTTLMGQENAEEAMPLGDFLDEVMELLQSEPDAKEILVERVKFLRFAEAEGRYDEVLDMLAGYQQH
jgi:uncharacterized oxidoreductase